MIDPRIPLQVQPMNLESPFEQIGKAMNLHTAQAQMQRADMDMQAKERALAEEQQLKALIQSGQPLDERNLFPVVGPTRGAAILKGLTDLKGAQIKTEGEMRAVIGSVIGALKAWPETGRAEAYWAARQGFIQRGWAKPEDIPEQYSPEVLDQFQQSAMTVEQQSQHADRLADNVRSDAEQADKRPGVMADNTRKASEALDAQLVTEGRLLGGATNTAEWKAALAQLPPDRAKRFPPMFSRTHQAFALKAAQTAEQRIQASQRHQQINEQARHNRVMESKEPLEAVMVDGVATLVPRSQAIGKQPAINMRATEDERKMVGFYGQMRDAIATLDEVETQLTEKELYQIQTMPQEGLVGMANRGQLSEPAKRYLRAFEQFTESRLRPVSGAAISDAEYARDRRTYAKQFSETPTLNADRRRARDGALSSLRMRAGVLAPDGESETPQAPKVGDVVTLNGKRVRITRLGPNGQAEGVEVK